MNQIEMQQDNWAVGLNGNQQKALSLLGQGISAVMVASTLGVSESLISQFLAEPRFANEVTKKKLAALQIQTDIDQKYAEAENKLVDKLLKTIPLISKPMDILRGLQVINATKRRGMADAPVNLAQTNIVQINLPASMAARFITNTANQIVEIEDGQGLRSLVTSTPEDVNRLANEFAEITPVDPAGVIRGEKDLVTISRETSPSTEDRIKHASEVLSRLGLAEISKQGSGSRGSFKGQITEADL